MFLASKYKLGVHRNKNDFNNNQWVVQFLNPGKMIKTCHGILLSKGSFPALDSIENVGDVSVPVHLEVLLLTDAVQTGPGTTWDYIINNLVSLQSELNIKTPIFFHSQRPWTHIMECCPKPYEG